MVYKKKGNSNQQAFFRAVLVTTFTLVAFLTIKGLPVANENGVTDPIMAFVWVFSNFMSIIPGWVILLAPVFLFLMFLLFVEN